MPGIMGQVVPFRNPLCTLDFVESSVADSEKAASMDMLKVLHSTTLVSRLSLDFTTLFHQYVVYNTLYLTALPNSSFTHYSIIYFLVTSV